MHGLEPLEQGLPQTGLTRCVALEEVSFSPYHSMTKCHSGGMLSYSLQTHVFPVGEL